MPGNKGRDKGIHQENQMNADIRKKGILLLVSLLLLASAAIYMAFAWYTKMTSVSELSFDTAMWDFNANYNVSDFTINVFSYPRKDDSGQLITTGKSAPGTSGWIPVKLSAAKSDIDVEYALWIDKSTMSSEFQERIFFYSDAAMTQKLGEMDASGDTNILSGTIPKGSEINLTLYWRWVYDYEEATTRMGHPPLTAASSAAFDIFDTQVGKNPDMYEPYMTANMHITGSQVKPEKKK